MLWVAVVRVSHLGSRDADSDRFHSVADQTTEIERAVQARGDRVHVLPPELDVSGGLPLDQRPALREAVEGIEQGRFGGLAVAYLSRMGRDLRVMLEAWERIELAGGRVLVARENIDSSTPSGRMQRNILAAIDQQQREEASAAFEQRCEQATAAGIWQRRQTPRGYDRDPETRRLTPSAQADEVQKAFRDRATGKPVAAVADRLGMTTSGVRALLRNRVYLGELRVRRYVNPAAHPALVTPAEFEAAQTAPRPPRAPATGIALLAGLVRCMSCGHVMTRGSGNRGARSYTCSGRKSGFRCPRPAAVNEPLTNQHVEAFARRALDGWQVVAQADDKVDRLQADLDRAREELAAYLSAVSATDVGPEAFAVGARERRLRMDEAQATLDGMTARSGIDVLGAIQVLDDGSSHERNQLLRSLLDAVVVRPVGRGQRIAVPDRVQILPAGQTAVTLPSRRRSVPMGLCPLPWLEDGHPCLRLPPSSDVTGTSDPG